MVDATIDVINRGGLECDQNYMIQGETLGTHDEPNPDLSYDEIPVWSLVIDHPQATILWDTGSHHDALEGHWPEGLLQTFYPHDAPEHRLDDDLEDAGYGIGDIDAVVQTHLHLDHAGGLEFFDGTDVPVYVHEKEIQFAYYSAKTDKGSGAYILEDFDHDLNWEIIHQDQEQHFADVEFIRLPGHTPGLMGTVVHLEEGAIIFTGDQVYQSPNYEDEIPLGGSLVWGKTEWFESLQRIKEIERRHDAEVVYGHDSDQFELIRDGWGR